MTFGIETIEHKSLSIGYLEQHKISLIIATYYFFGITYIKVTFLDKIQDKYQSLTTCSLLGNGAIPYQLQHQREGCTFKYRMGGLDI